jgi:hypothetical protein
LTRPRVFEGQDGLARKLVPHGFGGRVRPHAPRFGTAPAMAARHEQLFRDYGLAMVLAVLFIGSWIVQTLTGWVEFASQQQAHGEPAQLFGDSGYFWEWMAATFENWQSEFLQLFTMVVLTAFLIHKGSSESRDSDDEMMLELVAIRRELQQLKERKAGS